MNTVTPALFAAYPTPAALAAADPQRVEDIIRPIGFYHTKTRNIIALSAQLESRFAGRVPSTMEELVNCPAWAAKPPTWCSATRSTCPASPWIRM